MKTIMLKISFLCLMMFSLSSFAEKVVITGQPVVLEQGTGDVYTLPGDYTVSTTYNYVKVGDKNRVCYSDVQPLLAKANVDVMSVKVNVAGTPTTWNCYEYTDEYFTVSP